MAINLHLIHFFGAISVKNVTFQPRKIEFDCRRIINLHCLSAQYMPTERSRRLCLNFTTSEPSEARNAFTMVVTFLLSKFYRFRPEGRLQGNEHTRCLTTYDLDKIYLEQYLDDTFYKDCLTDENAFEEHLIVTYSKKYDNYQKQLRAQQKQRAITKIDLGEIPRPNSSRLPPCSQVLKMC